jgi:hypothetical protein
MLLATVSKSVLLSVIAADGRTDLYCRAQIIDSSGSPVTTIALPHQTLGMYGVNYTPSLEGYFNIIYQFYFDSGFTIPAGYESAAETLDVSSFRTDVLRVLGLAHENSVIDMQVYDGDENLTSARVRCYDSAVNASAASAISPTVYLTGLRFEYQVTASYSGSLLNKYNINRIL